MACNLAEVDLERLMAGTLSFFERQSVMHALANLSSLPLHILDRASLTPTAIYGVLRRLQARGPLGLVVLDYLQLLDTSGRHDSRNSAIGELSRAVKKMALELDVPFLVLSQLSRESEKQQRAPLLSDLRDSGCIEQDSDVVVFLHPTSTDEAAGTAEIEFLVRKHRCGRRGRVTMRFEGRFMKFVEVNEHSVGDISSGQGRKDLDVRRLHIPGS
jgi:replicative DNA helicase